VHEIKQESAVSPANLWMCGHRGDETRKHAGAHVACSLLQCRLITVMQSLLSCFVDNKIDARKGRVAKHSGYRAAKQTCIGSEEEQTNRQTYTKTSTHSFNLMNRSESKQTAKALGRSDLREGGPDIGVLEPTALSV
jgi:hypothetical protein